MTTVIFVLLCLAAITCIAVAASGGLGELPESNADRDSFVLPVGPLVPADVAGLRFGIGFRGYRMDEVDLTLNRLSAELAERDRQLVQIAEEHAITGGACD